MSGEDDHVILDLARKHRRPAEIYEELERKVPIGRIYRVLEEARRNGLTIPNFREDMAEGLLSRQVRDALMPHAAVRHITVTLLVRRILAKVAEDNLVDAVLDDRGP